MQCGILVKILEQKKASGKKMMKVKETYNARPMVVS